MLAFDSFNLSGRDSEALRILQSKAGPIIFALQLGYGLGAMAAPELVNAFLHKSSLQNTALTANTNSSMAYEGNIIVHPNISGEFNFTAIQYPYMIAGGLMGGLSIVFLVLFFLNYFGKYYVHTVLVSKEKVGIAGIFKMFSPGSCTDGKPLYGAIFICLHVVLIFHIDGVDTMYRQFLVSFAIESDNTRSTSQALNLNLIYWVSFTVGRVICMVLSTKIPIPYICATVVALSVGNSIILNVMIKTNSLIIVVCTSAFGILNASLIPAFVVFANYYIKMTGVAVGLVYVFAGSGIMVYISLTGHLFSLYGPGVYLTIILVGNTIIAVNYVILQVVAYIHGKKTEHD